ncbi:hypothetical protein G5B00_02655 [Parapedobacter sp. SGR-10]|uniref:hypothetical protein n=1 Tax=Parapedobacter sp. SGR-10 TaxID=2710879 RepID=UPI0013D1D997|nr:hypothetical protein [Parapedobacter sp. SGR-10]NGF55402.1 hypothetical protein [Parapedobacter sp. SGR-10]
MKINLYYITLWNLLSFFVFLGLLVGINIFLTNENIPFNQIITASILFCIVYVMLFASSWKLLSPARKDRVVGIVWALLVLALVACYAYPLIYDWLPRLGVYFHRVDTEFDVLEFWERIMWAMAFVWLLSAGAATTYRYIASRIQLRQAAAKRDIYRIRIERLQAQLETRHFSPHTIENVVAITMGRLTTENKEEYLDTLMVLAEILHYALRMQDERETASFAEEWRQVENLVMLGRVCFGDEGIVLHRPEKLPEGRLPMGIFVMPMENALKYATVARDKAIVIDLQRHVAGWRFTVTNSFRETKRQGIWSNRTGFTLLQQKIEGGNWPLAIERQERGDTFVVSIVSNLDNEI